MVLVPTLDHLFQRHISVGRRVGGKKVSAAVACVHLGVLSPPTPYPRLPFLASVLWRCGP